MPKYKKMEKKNSIILYDPNEINAIFILAAIKKLGFEIWSMERVWELFITNYSPIFVVPENLLKFPDLETYLWVSGGGVIDINNIKKTDPNPDIQLVLNTLRKNSVLNNTRDIKYQERWERNSMASRYGKALKAAKIFLNNKGRSGEMAGIISEAITEINEGKQSYNISMYEDNYNRCTSLLTQTKAKISYNCPVKLGNKQISYAYLDKISPWLDLEKLQKDLVILYPFITILQYRSNNREYTWIGSNHVNVSLIFNVKNKNPHSIILRGSHKKIINFLKTEAKSLSE